MAKLNRTRRDYQRSWAKQHPGYKAADSRRRALFRPATRALYREILGVRVIVNLIPLALRMTLRLVQKQRKNYL